MNIDHIRSKTLKLKYVISIYETESSDSYFDIAQVYKEKIMAFRPITESSLRKLLVKMLKMAGHKAIHRYNFSQTFTFPILHIGNSGKDVAFIEEGVAEREMIYLNKKIKLLSLPAVLYVVKDAVSLSVYEKLPSGRYAALNLPNISSSGSMCLGGKTLVKSAAENVNLLCAGYHDMFWNNSFTTHSDSTGCNWDKGVYKYASRKDVKSYTLKELL